jgi:hypothetical protein
MNLSFKNRLSNAHILLALLAVLMFFIYWLLTCNIGGFDDAFISYNFSQNIAHGNGFAWSKLGDPIYGSTTLTYTILLALLSFSGIEIPAISIFLGAFFWACSILVLAYFFKARLNIFNVLLSLVLVAVSLTAVRNSYGMETSFFTFIALLTFKAYLNKSFRLVSILSWLLVFTRIDGILVPGIIFLHMFLTSNFVFTPKFFFKQKHIYSNLILFVGLLAVTTVCIQLYFGQPLPSSFLAKLILNETGSGAISFKALWDYLGGGFYDFDMNKSILHIFSATSLILIFLTIITKNNLKSWDTELPLIWSLLYVLVFQIKKAPLFPWYLSPTLFVLLAYTGFYLLAPLPKKFKMLNIVKIIIYILLVTSATVNTINTIRADIGGSNIYKVEERRIMAHAILNDRKDLEGVYFKVMAFEMGFLGYFLPDAEVFDVLGLVTPEVVFDKSLRHDPVAKYIKWNPDYTVIVDANLYQPTGSLNQNIDFQREQDVIFNLPREFGHNYIVYKKRDTKHSLEDLNHKISERLLDDKTNTLTFHFKEKITIKENGLICFDNVEKSLFNSSFEFYTNDSWIPPSANHFFTLERGCVRAYQEMQFSALRIKANINLSGKNLNLFKSVR